MANKKAVIITKNYTRMDNRELIVIFNKEFSSVGIDIIENKNDKCKTVHLTNEETRSLYLLLKDVYECE